MGQITRYVAGTLAVATLVGCSGTAARSAESRRGAPAAGSRSTPPSLTSVPTTGTTLRRAPKPAPPYSFDGSVPPPRIVDTGSNLVAIGTSLVDYSQWLYAHDPEVSLIPNFAAGASRSAEASLKDLPMLTKSKLRLYEVESRPRQVSLISTDGTAASLRYVQFRAAQRLVNQSGKLVDQRAFVAPTIYTIIMVKNSHGEWRLASIENTSATR